MDWPHGLPMWAARFAPLAREPGRSLAQVLSGRDVAPMWRSRRRRRAAAVCTALAVVLLGFVLIGVNVALTSVPAFSTPPLVGAWQPRVIEYFLVFAVLLLAVRYPLMAWRVAFLSVLFVPAIPGEPRLDVLVSGALVIAWWVACLRLSRPAVWWMAVLTLAPVWSWVGPGWLRPVLAMVGLVIVATALDARATARRARHALAEQVDQTELQESRRAVLEERTRIAREMHDVVAHHMSMIAVQAETAPYRLPGLTDGSAAEFASLSDSARRALSDLRRLLGVLRSEEPTRRAPQPGLADLPELVEAARRAGVVVELAMPPTGTADVAPSVGLCAYRIVQEALSNAGRHSPGAEVNIKVRLEPGALRLEVSNGRPTSATPVPGAASSSERPGHGLAGMHERATLLGGLVSAGPSERGGFVVSTVLPLEESELK